MARTYSMPQHRKVLKRLADGRAETEDEWNLEMPDEDFPGVEWGAPTVDILWEVLDDETGEVTDYVGAGWLYNDPEGDRLPDDPEKAVAMIQRMVRDATEDIIWAGPDAIPQRFAVTIHQQLIYDHNGEWAGYPGIELSAWPVVSPVLSDDEYMRERLSEYFAPRENA